MGLGHHASIEISRATGLGRRALDSRRDSAATLVYCAFSSPHGSRVSGTAARSHRSTGAEFRYPPLPFPHSEVLTCLARDSDLPWEARGDRRRPTATGSLGVGAYRLGCSAEDDILVPKSSPLLGLRIDSGAILKLAATALLKKRPSVHRFPLPVLFRPERSSRHVDAPMGIDGGTPGGSESPSGQGTGEAEGFLGGTFTVGELPNRRGVRRKQSCRGRRIVPTAARIGPDERKYPHPTFGSLRLTVFSAEPISQSSISHRLLPSRQPKP